MHMCLGWINLQHDDDDECTCFAALWSIPNAHVQCTCMTSIHEATRKIKAVIYWKVSHP
jgi:hypothetical protein